MQKRYYCIKIDATNLSSYSEMPSFFITFILILLANHTLAAQLFTSGLLSESQIGKTQFAS